MCHSKQNNESAENEGVSQPFLRQKKDERKRPIVFLIKRKSFTSQLVLFLLLFHFVKR